MRIIPKKTKYHLAFRNKVQTKKIKKYDHRINSSLGGGNPSNTSNRSNWLQTNAWIPEHPFVQKEEIHMEHRQGNNYLSHPYANQLLFGTYGILFEKHGKLSGKFVETVRLDIAKMLKKKSKVWLRICCGTPVTARPVETRMGKGKGAISHWEAKVSPGQIFFEFSGVTRARAKEILINLEKKSPIDLKLI